MDCESEAGKLLKEAEKKRDEAKANNLPSLKRLEGEFTKAQREHKEALATLKHIKWLLNPEGLYPKFNVVTPEEYAAYKKSRTADIARGRAALRCHYPCTPSRNARTEGRQQG